MLRWAGAPRDHFTSCQAMPFNLFISDFQNISSSIFEKMSKIFFHSLKKFSTAGVTNVTMKLNNLRDIILHHIGPCL